MCTSAAAAAPSVSALNANTAQVLGVAAGTGAVHREPRPRRGSGSAWAARFDGTDNSANDAANDAASQQLALSPPAAWEGSALPSPFRLPLARLDALLFRPDASQRPWGMAVASGARPRFVLEAPQEVGAAGRVTVWAHAEVCWGVTLGAAISVSVVGLITLWLPAAALGALPKGLIALCTVVALGFTPRGGLGYQRRIACSASLTPEELAWVAARRDGWLQWALEALACDGLRALPRPLAAAANGLPSPGHGRVWERGRTSEWGGGFAWGKGVAPLAFMRHSNLRHHSGGRVLSCQRAGDGSVRLQLSELVERSWRAGFNEGLLWGIEHSGAGRQELRVRRCDVAAAACATAPAPPLFDAAFRRGAPLAEAVVDGDETLSYQVHSHGESWRVPWSLPRFKSFGAGHFLQRYTVDGRLPQGAHSRRAIGVVGMHEGWESGRVQWHLQLRWPAAAAASAAASPEATGEASGEATGEATAADAAAPYRAVLELYVPWLDAERQAALQRLLGPSLFPSRASWPEAGGTWRKDLLLRLEASCDRERLSAVAAAHAATAGTAQISALDRVRERVDAALALLYRRFGQNVAAPSFAADDEALLHQLAALGPAFFAEDAIRPSALRVSYGQTDALLQDAAFHLALRPTDAAPPTWLWPKRWAPHAGWSRRSRALLQRIDAEVAALDACPFHGAMAPPHRNEAEAKLQRLRARLQGAGVGGPDGTLGVTSSGQVPGP